MRTGIYAILDTVADMIVGGLHLHKHDAAAIRMFTDIASSDGTTINKHPEDFELIYLGALYNPDPDGRHTIVDLGGSKHTTIITGKQYLAVSQPPIGERHNNTDPTRAAAPGTGGTPAAPQLTVTTRS